MTTNQEEDLLQQEMQQLGFSQADICDELERRRELFQQKPAVGDDVLWALTDSSRIHEGRVIGRSPNTVVVEDGTGTRVVVQPWKIRAIRPLAKGK